MKNISTYAKGIFQRINSTSLKVTKSGTCNDNLTIEVVPSTDNNNSFTLGTDGRPFVSSTEISFVPVPCLTFERVQQGNKVTFVPKLDWNCVAQNICGLCENPTPCVAPNGVIILNAGQNSIQLSWNMVAGNNYDILVNGQLYEANVIGPFTINGLAPNTTYAIAVRAKCPSGTTADTTVSVTTLSITSCSLPSNLTISII